MHRIDDASAIAGQFNDNPGVQTPTTRVTSAWLNDVQGNIAEVIEGAGIALVKGDFGQLLEAIQAIVDAGSAATRIPVGVRVSLDGSVLPAGWLYLDGAEHLRADYPDLVDWYDDQGRLIAGTTLDHFRVPDYQGYFDRAWSSDDSVDPQGPRGPGAVQETAFPAHTHTLPSNSANGTANGFIEDTDGVGTPRAAETGSTGSGTESRPPNVSSVWIIKT